MRWADGADGVNGLCLAAESAGSQLRCEDANDRQVPGTPLQDDPAVQAECSAARQPGSKPAVLPACRSGRKPGESALSRQPGMPLQHADEPPSMESQKLPQAWQSVHVCMQVEPEAEGPASANKDWKWHALGRGPCIRSSKDGEEGIYCAHVES